MLVSVVIPVYKAEEYLKEAVESALDQRETGEVILVEDNSPDGSLEICKELAASNEKVKVFRHPGGRNCGAGASRNLGIRNARCEFVAFLDADDVYLDNRFSEADRLFEKHSDIDGVYEAVGVHFQDFEAKEKWLSWGHEELITMKERVSPVDLFLAIVEHGIGWLHLNGLVIKRTVFDRCGFFFEHLKLHQDSAFFLQLAALCQLYPGRLDKAVALRRVHHHNRIPGANAATRALHFRTLFHWALERQLERRKLEVLFRRYLHFCVASMRDSNSPMEYSAEMRNLFVDVLTHPCLSLSVACVRMRKGIRSS
jgi:glycosyltransferase involved in cell wall biosynthesis